MSFSSSLLKNTLSGWFSIVVNILVKLITIPILVNGLGKQDYSLWLLVTNIISYLYLFDLGLSNAIGRLYAALKCQNESNKINELIGSSYSFILFCSFCILGIILITPANILHGFLNIPANQKEAFTICLSISLAEFIFMFLTRIDTGILQGEKKFHIIWLLDSFTQFLGLIIVIILQKTNHITLANTILLLALTRILGALLTAYYAKFWEQKLLPFKFFTWQSIKKTLDLGISNLATSIAGMIQLALPPIFYSRYFGVESVFYYSFSLTIILILSRFINTIYINFLPRVSELNAQNKTEEIQKIIKSGIVFSTFICGLFYIFCSVAMEDILKIWLSKKTLNENDFKTLINFTILGAISFFFSNAQKTTSIVFRSAGKHWLATHLAIVNIVIFTSTGFFFCHIGNIYAFALASIIASIGDVLLYFIFLHFYTSYKVNIKKIFSLSIMLPVLLLSFFTIALYLIPHPTNTNKVILAFILTIFFTAYYFFLPFKNEFPQQIERFTTFITNTSWFKR